MAKDFQLFAESPSYPVPRMNVQQHDFEISFSFEEHHDTVLAQVPNYLHWQKPRSTPRPVSRSSILNGTGQRLRN